MRTLIDTLCGLWHLAHLTARTGFRFRGPYWRWRLETAFGANLARCPSRRARCHAILHYARWVHRMKRGR